MIHPTGQTGHPLREKEPQIATPHPYHDRKVARIQEQLRDRVEEQKRLVAKDPDAGNYIGTRLAIDEVESLLLHIETLERRVEAADANVQGLKRQRDDLLEKAERLQVTWEKVKELEERLTAARRERDEVYAVNAANANGRARSLAETLKRVLGQPRWLSIGSVNNTAELHLTRNAYDAALTLAHAELGPPPEPERMTKDEFKDYIRTGRRVPKHLPGSAVHAEAVTELVVEGVLTPADAGVANRFIDAVAEASGDVA